MVSTQNKSDFAAQPYRQIRAVHDAETVTVYQAYSAEIAGPAVAAQRFVSPFKSGRMTWIKPSFLWMMYRSGWATKPGQEQILRIRIEREFFDTALAHSALAAYEPDLHESHEQWRQELHGSEVRVQWDPERDLNSAPLGHRSLQLGLKGDMSLSYSRDAIVDILDVTDEVTLMRRALDGGLTANTARLPPESPYPVADSLAKRLGMSPA